MQLAVTVSNGHNVYFEFKFIDNWWDLVPSKVGGGPAKVPGTAGRLNGNPLSGNQACKGPPTSTVTLKGASVEKFTLTLYLP